MEDWKEGRGEDWKGDGGREGRKIGRMEGGKRKGRMEGGKDGRREGWKGEGWILDVLGVYEKKVRVFPINKTQRCERCIERVYLNSHSSFFLSNN